MRGLDTYIGRPVVNIQTNTDGNWFVELIGGVRIVNTDPNMPPPDIANPQNLIFVAVIMGESQTQMSLATLSGSGELLNEFRVTLNPVQYQIYDPEQGQAWSPQSGMPVVEVPPYPSERVVDGPEPRLGEETPTGEKPAQEKPKKAQKRSSKSSSKKKSDK